MLVLMVTLYFFFSRRGRDTSFVCDWSSDVCSSDLHSLNSTVRLVTLGDQMVTVASPLMTSATATVTVTPAVSKLAVSAPVASVAGDTFDVTVTRSEERRVGKVCGQRLSTTLQASSN